MTYAPEVPPREIYTTIDCTDDGENGFSTFIEMTTLRQLRRDGTSNKSRSYCCSA